MDKFGQHWYKHHEKIEAAWKRMVSEDDVVLIPGDHSWAMKIDEALPDLEWIASLPGTKIMGKGNHDLWWHSLSRLEALGLRGIRWLQNNAMIYDGVGIVGTRGWSLPGSDTTPEDEKIHKRELERFKLSVQALDKMRQKAGGSTGETIAMLHYPPILIDRRQTDWTDLMEQHGIDLCIYGHIHLSHHSRLFRGTQNGVRYEVVSCDFADFAPLELLPARSPQADVAAPA